MDSFDYSKQYIVFSVSKLDLHHDLGFPDEVVAALTEEDMQKIAELVRENYYYLEEDYTEIVRFVTSLVLI